MISEEVSERCGLSGMIVLEMKVALDFEYENFSIHKEQQNMCPVKIGLIFYFVIYIYIYWHSFKINVFSKKLCFKRMK